MFRLLLYRNERLRSSRDKPFELIVTLSTQLDAFRTDAAFVRMMPEMPSRIDVMLCQLSRLSAFRTSPYIE